MTGGRLPLVWIPVETELTVQQAADLLNVSRSYLLKLLDEGEMPCASNRGLRFVRADDLFAYKKKRDAIRSKALCELIQIDIEEGLL